MCSEIKKLNWQVFSKVLHTLILIATGEGEMVTGDMSGFRQSKVVSGQNLLGRGRISQVMSTARDAFTRSFPKGAKMREYTVAWSGAHQRLPPNAAKLGSRLQSNTETPTIVGRSKPYLSHGQSIGQPQYSCIFLSTFQAIHRLAVMSCIGTGWNQMSRSLEHGAECISQCINCEAGE